jgi:predicted dehydrogenase
MDSSLKTIRWGILGTGKIARDFTQDLTALPEAKVLAVGSRSLSTAQAFSGAFKIPRAYGSYEELVKDPDIDVVYIATPHIRHKDDCILCLEAGKPVLCEKPFTLNAQEAREVIALAREKQLFCMEAMWMRFMPLIQTIRQLIQSGEIGEVRTLTADFGYAVEFTPTHHLFDLKSGGGALLDRGVYPLSLAFFLLGIPDRITSEATLGNTGVDEQCAMVLSYHTGQLAMLSANLRATTSNEVIIGGTRGQIRIFAPFYRPHQISISKYSPASLSAAASSSSGIKQKIVAAAKSNSLVQRLYLQLGSFGKKSQKIFQPVAGNGYQYEASEVIRCLKNGKLESEIMPLNETLSIMEAMDAIRHHWNLQYPQETGGI